MQIGQGESLVHFLCPALATRPSQAVVVVKSGQDGLSQTLYLQKWPKSAFEIVVRIERKKISAVNVPNGVSDVPHWYVAILSLLRYHKIRKSLSDE